MSGAPALLPNLGGEESGQGDDWRRALRLPRVAAAAHLWRLVFGAGASWADDGAARILGETRWPSDLGPAVDEPSLSWLAEAAGTIPWLADLGGAGAPDPDVGTGPFGTPRDIARRLHDKAFAVRAAQELGLDPPPLRGLTEIFEPEALADPRALHRRVRERVGAWPPFAGGHFVLKPRIGTSGRGTIRGTVDPGEAQTPPAGWPRGLELLADRGGAVLEPWLARERDLSAQLRVAADGAVHLLGTLEQIVGRNGAWQGHLGEVDSRGRVFSGLPEDEDLRGAAGAVAARAAEAGYRGPAGLDAFTFRFDDGDGARTLLRPVVEWNARFTMGVVASGLVRRTLPRVRESLGLEPGDRRAFCLRMEAPPGGWEPVCEALEASLLIRLADGAELQPALLFAPDRDALEAAVPIRGSDRSPEPGS